jgi:hypothetical protein
MIALGDLYEEKLAFPPKGTFELQKTKKPVEAKANKKAFISTPSGPEEADGFKKDKVDAKDSKKANFFEPEKFSQNYEKIEIKKINNSMNKSIFDTLYEDVMSDRHEEAETHDAEALGLPVGEEGAGEEGSSEEVTVTLDRETAKKLHDVLMAVLGDVESETEDEVEGEEEGEDEMEEHTYGEATDIQELKGKGESLQGKNNKVGDVTAKLVSKGGGEGKTTDEVSVKSTGKHALVQDLDSGHLASKSSDKVASKTSKVGEYLAGLKK